MNGSIARRLLSLIPMSRRALTPEAKAAIRDVLEHAKFELIPLKNVLDQAKHLPAGATVSVTASPAKGLDATIDLSADLQQMGFDVVPHLSARLTKDRAHLEAIVKRLDELDITKIFLVGGDAEEPGDYFDGLSLLRDLDEIGHRFEEIGIPAYPEGHAVIPTDSLDEALLDKQPYAAYMATQMCFDGSAIKSWLAGQRARGIDLPVVLGLPGVADRLKLLTISARIGVGDSVRFLKKNTSLVSKFVKPGGYSPAELLEDLGAYVGDENANIVGAHIYTFNQCDTTEAWRQDYLASLV